MSAVIFTDSTSAAKIDIVKEFTLEYWKDHGWYVGRLKEMPAVMSQGETLEELQAMIRDAYHLMVEDAAESAFVPKEKQKLSISL
jgi:predicted RNase H-like HicB family nuclease